MQHREVVTEYESLVISDLHYRLSRTQTHNSRRRRLCATACCCVPMNFTGHGDWSTIGRCMIFVRVKIGKSVPYVRAVSKRDSFSCCTIQHLRGRSKGLFAFPDFGITRTTADIKEACAIRLYTGPSFPMERRAAAVWDDRS